MTVLILEEAHDEATFGGKATQLGAALRAGLPVPRGFALSHHAVDAVASGDRGHLASWPALEALARGVAVRSSAIGEDSGSASFAGQHATVLGVRSVDGLISAIAHVHASARTDAALAYRRKLGLDASPRMAIAVQSLVYADVAGVAFSRDPVTGEDARVIEASWGLGEVVVSGQVTPDRFKILRSGRVVERTPGEKDIALHWDEAGGGTREVEVEPDRVEALCLDDGQLGRLHELVGACERVFGGGQDIEFAFANGELFLLQRRAITRG